jgi:hypothetical protein
MLPPSIASVQLSLPTPPKNSKWFQSFSKHQILPTSPPHYTPQTWKLVLGWYHTYSYTYVLELDVVPNLLEMGSMMVVPDNKMVIGMAYIY